MIKPHGSDMLQPLCSEDPKVIGALQQEAKTLPSLLINSSAAANAVMLGGGYFTPLTGFMNRAEALSVAKNMETKDGLLWPIPILNLCQEKPQFQLGQRIALLDPNMPGTPPLAIQTVESIDALSSTDIESIVKGVFLTLDSKHPGVATFTSLGHYCIAGKLEVLNYSYFQRDFPDTFRTATQIRNQIAANGWQKTVAFQTRNPMHRAHEELCKMAIEGIGADGLLIHMLLGKLKPGDIPADVRDAAIRKMVEIYFPANQTIISGYGFDMLYAGPKEAILHAVFRQNCGCSHLIVGRDHAGVGDYYGAFDAQTIFSEQVPSGALQIEIFNADHTAYSKKLERVVMMRDAPDHNKEDFVLLSGTKVREMLANGQDLPPEFARPEVAQILMRHYQTQN